MNMRCHDRADIYRNMIPSFNTDCSRATRIRFRKNDFVT